MGDTARCGPASGDAGWCRSAVLKVGMRRDGVLVYMGVDRTNRRAGGGGVAHGRVRQVAEHRFVSGGAVWGAHRRAHRADQRADGAPGRLKRTKHAAHI